MQLSGLQASVRAMQGGRKGGVGCGGGGTSGSAAQSLDAPITVHRCKCIQPLTDSSPRRTLRDLPPSVLLLFFLLSVCLFLSLPPFPILSGSLSRGGARRLVLAKHSERK